MTVANAGLATTRGLPKELMVAQEAINFPEVQEMLRKLADYNLGVFMPHMHGEQGRFQPLPDDMMQLEGGLEVTFQPTQEVLNGTEQYVPVGWFWRGDNLPSVAMGCVKRPPDTMHYGT